MTCPDIFSFVSTLAGNAAAYKQNTTNADALALNKPLAQIVHQANLANTVHLATTVSNAAATLVHNGRLINRASTLHACLYRSIRSDALFLIGINAAHSPKIPQATAAKSGRPCKVISMAIPDKNGPVKAPTPHATESSA